MKHHEFSLSRSRNIAAVLATAILVLNVEAAVYFQGKEVLRKSKAVADVAAIFWAPVKNSTTSDRIQVRLNIDTGWLIDGPFISRQSFYVP
ncbi:MAG: hypothetical protein J6Z49_09010 [Kiritimatiellae bacterium]|nr:hypothetical protein [Kiritimatiellia bacterium]